MHMSNLRKKVLTNLADIYIYVESFILKQPISYMHTYM